MMINVSSLFICTANYSKLFGETTDHMLLFLAFVMNIMPEVITPELAHTTELLKNVGMTQSMTPTDFFDMFEQLQHALPRYGRELAKDLEDTIDFYHLSFREIRAGEIKSHRILRIPEY
jgi:hypothetical protein